MEAAAKTKEVVQTDGNNPVNFKQLIISVVLLIILVGSIFSFVPFLDNVNEVKEHEKLYPEIEKKFNSKELNLFKKYKSQLPKEYADELITIKRTHKAEITEYKKRKEEIIEKQNVFGFDSISTFLQYMGMYVSFIALSICAFIYKRVEDKTAGLIFEILFIGCVLIGFFFIQYALYQGTNIPHIFHYLAFVLYIVLSVFLFKILHKYLENFGFYSIAIKKLNGLLLSHPTKYISPNKRNQYLTDTLEKIDETLYPNEE